MFFNRLFITYVLFAGVMLFWFCDQAYGDSAQEKGPLKMEIPPNVEFSFGGAIGERIDATLNRWWLIVPYSNPGLVEAYTARGRFYAGRPAHATEYAGKYLIGAIQGWRLTKSAKLEVVIHEMIDKIIATQGKDGYLGVLADKYRFGEYDLWGQYHLMQALMMYYEESGYQPAFDAVVRQADNICNTYLNSEDTPADIEKPLSKMHWFDHSIIHAFGEIYRKTNEPRYLKMVRLIEKKWQYAEDLLRTGLSDIEFYKTPWPRWETMHQLQGLVELYRITGNKDYKTAFVNHWQSIRNYERHNNGACTTIEWAIGTPYWPSSFETCTTVAWTIISEDMLRLTGDSTVADELELSLFNAILGMQHPTSRWWTYDTPSDGVRRAICSMWAAAHTRPGLSEIMCCTANGPRGLGMLSEWAVMTDGEGPLINYYGPSEIKLKLSSGKDLMLHQTTCYPVDGAIKLKLVLDDSPAIFNLRLRIPAWSNKTKVCVNGQAIDNVTPGTYLSIKRQWQSGDIVALDLDMTTRYWLGQQSAKGKASIYYGPILLALDEHYDPINYDKNPVIDLTSLVLIRETSKHQDYLAPLFSCKLNASDGTMVRLCDFASAGVHGMKYRSWLPAINGLPSTFDLKSPANNTTIAAGPARFEWIGVSSLDDSSLTYDITVADNKSFDNPVFHKSDLHQNIAVNDKGFKPGSSYYWKVTAKNSTGFVENSHGPRCFSVDLSQTNAIKSGLEFIPEWPDWIITSSPLDGDANPSHGRLVEEVDIQGSIDRHGDSNGAIAFDGKSSLIQYEISEFPGLYYSVQAWVYIEQSDDNERLIFNASAGKDDIGLQIYVRNNEIVAHAKKGLVFDMKTTGVKIEPRHWIHVVVVKEGYNYRLYIDGQLKATESDPMQTCTHSKALIVTLGGNLDKIPNEYYYGQIDDFTFYATSLKPDRIKKIYDFSKPNLH